MLKEEGIWVIIILELANRSEMKEEV